MLDLRRATPDELVKIRNLVSLCVVEAGNDKLPMIELALEMLAWSRVLLQDSDIGTERDVMMRQLREEMDYNAIRKARSS